MTELSPTTLSGRRHIFTVSILLWPYKTTIDLNSTYNLVSHSQLRANGTKVHFADDSFVLATASGLIYAKESYGLYWFQLEDATFTSPPISADIGPSHPTKRLLAPSCPAIPSASQPGGEIDISSAVQSLPSRPPIPAASQPMSRGEIDVGPDDSLHDLPSHLLDSDANIIEPKSLRQAQKDKTSWARCYSAMTKEYNSLQANKTWTPRPEDRKALCAKWVYKLKRGPHGEVVRYKARWVVRGFEQERVFQVQETFASVVKPMSYKVMFAIVTALDLELHQMDVKPAFLHGLINDLVYVEQPGGLDLLNKALYGLIC